MPASVSEDSPGPSSSPDLSALTPNSRRALLMRNRERQRDVSGSKRKRADKTVDEGRASRRRTIEPEDRDGDDDSDIYDPDQPLEERRDIQRNLRELNQDLLDNTEEYLRPDSDGIHKLLASVNSISVRIKQTTEAVIDSRLLVTAADLSYKKTVRITQGNTAEGVDIDEFVSKCITYMRQGAGNHGDEAPGLSSTQVQRRRRAARGQEGSDDEDEDGDMMNWGYFGHFACFPNIGRPPIQGHLLGPLSVEKKARKIAKRTARLQANKLKETRPEIINAEDLTRQDNDLAVICGRVLQQLTVKQREIQEKVMAAVSDDMPDEEQVRLMHRHGLRSTGGIDMMRFVVNPRSFAQSIENLFYVCFLIKDGKVVIDFDDHDLPSIAPTDTGEEEETSRRQAKYQAVFSIDMDTWRGIIDAFGIEEPMIEHRQEASQNGPGATGWYS